MTDQSFPRTARLVNGKAYAVVFKRNQRFGDRFWTVLVHRSLVPESVGRLGLAVAKKRARRAVDRNRIKRVAREQFRLHRQMLNGLDLVVMNRDPAASASAKQLGNSLQALIGRIVAQSSQGDIAGDTAGDAADKSSRPDKGAQQTQ